MKQTAKDIVNTYSEMELYRIIRDYGEDRFAKNIAKHIVQARQKKEIETTGELTEIIRASIPAKVRATGGHPAKRTFQAIRIELNQELDVLEDSIDTMIDLPGTGRTAFDHYLPFPGRSDRKEPFQDRMKIHASARRIFRSVCVDAKSQRQGDYKKADSSDRSGDWKKTRVPKSAKLRVFEKS
ncbi:MAG: 16S rRNA (cytosine(1402)-N(4))-methyltransferase [Clostridium fessum]